MKTILFSICLSISMTYSLSAQNNLRILEEIGFENLAEIQDETTII